MSLTPRVLLCLIFIAHWFGTEKSLAIVDANSASNTNAPTDGAPWSNVLGVNGASGVYVANGWVLTAAHVGAGNIQVSGKSYLYDGNSHRLTNSTGSLTDMVLFHLNPVPPLPPVPLASSTPAAGTAVDMIAHGLIAGSASTNFGNLTGFYWSITGAKSWGNNKVDAGGVFTVVNGIYGSVSAFGATFTAPGPSQTSHEGQGVAGDSGGGVFQSTASGWQLVGMLVAVSVQGPTSTSVYGDRTFSANIPTYRSQMLSIINSTPPVLRIARSGSSAWVCWPDTGITYDLQAKPSLSQFTWTNVTLPRITTNGQVCVLVRATNTASFFRLRKP